MGRETEIEFQRLIDAYTGPLRRLCAAYLPDRSDQQDLFQEIAMALWRALPGFRAAASERTWVYRVAHNVALTWAGKRRRQQQREQVIDGGLQDPAPEQDFRRLALLQCVRQLEPVDQQLMLLYLEGLTAREMEEVMGMTANSIEVRLTRLRRKLTETIGGGATK